MKTGKRLKEARAKIDGDKKYGAEEAIRLVKETAAVKFDSAVEAHVRLGIDPKKSDQQVRASVTLPHGSGKKIRIAAFVPDDKIEAVKGAGAEIAGSDDLIEEVKKTGKCAFDVAVATPDMMKKLASVARLLGQKGLMPNPKTGTITDKPEEAVTELKRGKLSYKNDSSGNVHVVIGRVSFDDAKLLENYSQFMASLKRAKPESMKGTFIKSVALASTMGPSVKVQI